MTSPTRKHREPGYHDDANLAFHGADLRRMRRMVRIWPEVSSVLSVTRVGIALNQACLEELNGDLQWTLSFLWHCLQGSDFEETSKSVRILCHDNSKSQAEEGVFANSGLSSLRCSSPCLLGA